MRGEKDCKHYILANAVIPQQQNYNIQKSGLPKKHERAAGAYETYYRARYIA